MDRTDLRAKLVARVGGDRGTTLVELLVVAVVMSLVLTGVVSIYLSGVQTQAGLTAGFQSQTELHLGTDRMRKDVNQACSQTAQSATSVTLSEPPCDGTVLITWCTQGSGSVYGLYRVVGSSCSGGTKWANYLTSGSIFSYLAANSPAGSYALPRLHLNMTVNSSPSNGAFGYKQVDDLVFRNAVRQ